MKQITLGALAILLMVASHANAGDGKEDSGSVGAVAVIDAGLEPSDPGDVKGDPGDVKGDPGDVKGGGSPAAITISQPRSRIGFTREDAI